MIKNLLIILTVKTILVYVMIVQDVNQRLIEDGIPVTTTLTQELLVSFFFPGLMPFILGIIIYFVIASFFEEDEPQSQNNTGKR